MKTIEQNITAVIFDLDGVIVDTVPVIQASVDMLCEQHRITIPTIDWSKKIDNLFFDHLRAIIKENNDELPQNEIEFLISRYRDFYTTNLESEAIPYSGISDVLRQLAQQYQLAIVTNRSTVEGNKLVEGAKVKLFFKEIFYSDQTGYKKPSPESILFALNKLKINNQQAVYVGDAEEDMISANLAGVPFIYATYGYGGVFNLINAVATIDEPLELLKLFRK